jgi:nucleoside-diphosphate-sugar epimerase
MGERTFPPLLQGKAAQITGRMDVPHTYTYTHDFGRALVLLGERPEADGQAWHVPNDMPRITQGELVRMFAEEAGVPLKISRVNKFAMTLAGLFIPEAKESVEMMYEFDQPFIVDSSKFEKTFGWKATPMHEAIRETVEWYRMHPRRG